MIGYIKTVEITLDKMNGYSSCKIYEDPEFEINLGSTNATHNTDHVGMGSVRWYTHGCKIEISGSKSLRPLLDEILEVIPLMEKKPNVRFSGYKISNTDKAKLRKFISNAFADHIKNHPAKLKNILKGIREHGIAEGRAEIQYEFNKLMRI